MLSSSFWPGLCAFAGVTLASLVLIDFALYVAARYRERYLEEAGTELDDILIQIPANRMLDLSVALSVFAMLATVLILSLRDDRFSWSWTAVIAIAVGAAVFPLPRLLLRILRKRRLEKFNFQLEDGLGIMSSALKAGFSINQALEEVAAQNLHPIAVEFRLLIQELRLGVPLDQALDTMCRRLGSDDFELVATSITTARQTGGELTGSLDRVAALIRERVRIAAKVRAVTAMGRLQAVMIGAMPFVLMLGMSFVAPQMMDMFFDSVLGIVAIVLVVVLDIAGFLVIRTITTIEV